MQVPKLPYDPVQRQALPGVQNNNQVDANLYGANIGQSISGAADQFQQIAIKARDEADQVAVEDRLNQFDTKNNARLATAGETKGEAAFGLPKSVNEEFDKDSSEIANTLTSDRQKKLYERNIAGRKVATNRFLDAHVAGQAAAYREETYQSSKANALNTVGVNYADEGVVNAAINDQVSRTERYAKDTGKSPTWLQQEHSNVVSSAHGEVISQFLTIQDTTGAQQHFDRYSDEMNAQDKEAVTKALTGAVDLKKSQGAVDALLAEKGEINGGISLQDGLDKIRDQYKEEPRARELAEQRWVTSFSRREINRKDENNAIFSRLLSAVVDPQNPNGLDSASMVDQTALMNRDPELFGKIQQYNAAKLRREEPKTDPIVYLGLQRMAALDPVGFARPETLYNNINKLSPADFQTLVGLQRETLKSGSNGPMAQGIITRDDVVDNMYRNILQKEKKDWSQADRQTANQFATVLDNAVRGQQSATGKVMTPSEVKELAEKLLVQKTVETPAGAAGRSFDMVGFGYPGALFGIGRPSQTQVPAFSVPGAEKVAFNIAQVPAGYRDAATAKITAKGGVPSEAAIVAAYNADLLKQPNAK